MNIAEWDKWQSYRKDRGTPPWIKVHRNLMTNPEWAVLTDSEKGQLVSIWIVAADKGGEIPDDPHIVRKVCQLDETPNINKFIELGFIAAHCQPSDVTVTPARQPYDAPESESEAEAETKEKTIDESQGISRFTEFWNEYNDKRGKAAAIRVWKRKKLDNIADLVIAGAIEYTIARGKERKYWKQAQGWLNDGRWDDVPVQATDNNESAYQRVCRKSKEREEDGSVIDNTLALEAGF